jgi:8-oxo-dGTP pyrophosphatase MutT (NUDIX family)
MRGESAYQPPLPWSIGAFVVIHDESGDVLWVKRTDYDLWNLPGGGSKPGEAPWSAAIRETREETGLNVELIGCNGIYVKPRQNMMVFSFTARVISGVLTTGDEAAAFAYFSPGNELENTLPKHIERVANAVASPDATQFRIQDGPSGPETLGISHSPGRKGASSAAGK